MSGLKDNLAFSGDFETNEENWNSRNDALEDGTRQVITSGLMTNLGVTNPAGAVALSLLNAGYALDLRLSAMQQQGRGEVISNPRIVTSNQREAVIKQGREVGYVTIQPATAGGVATPSVQF